MREGNRTRVLVRPRNGRMVAGVCAGAAEYFGIGVTLVRALMAVVAVITGGAGVLAYLAAWAIIPGQGEKTPSIRTSPARNRTPQQAGGPRAGFRPSSGEGS
jgi:phage shock protein PspC (stress-responsive transcriptional regulator)